MPYSFIYMYQLLCLMDFFLSKIQLSNSYTFILLVQVNQLDIDKQKCLLLHLNLLLSSGKINISFSEER